MSRPFFLIAFTAFLILASTLPITNAVDAQVRDFILDNGIVIDNLDSTSGWVQSPYASMSLDTVVKVEGSASLKLYATENA